MNKIQFNRLVKLYKFHVDNFSKLENEFDFTEINVGYPSKVFKIHDCGSVRCIIGNMPLALPTLFTYEDYDVVLRSGDIDDEDTRARIFGLNERENSRLFYYAEDNDHAMLKGSATLEEVLQNFKQFLNEKAKENKWGW